jgi:hypothetical protein
MNLSLRDERVCLLNDIDDLNGSNLQIKHVQEPSCKQHIVLMEYIVENEPSIQEEIEQNDMSSNQFSFEEITKLTNTKILDSYQVEVSELRHIDRLLKETPNEFCKYSRKIH